MDLTIKHCCLPFAQTVNEPVSLYKQPMLAVFKNYKIDPLRSMGLPSCSLTVKCNLHQGSHLHVILKALCLYILPFLRESRKCPDWNCK